VTGFSLDSSGNVAGAGTNVPEPAGATSPQAIAVNPAATRLYVANFNTNNVTVFSLDSSGNIAGAGTNVPEPAGASFPEGIVVR
jgi:DNA-binding beta-propeller fold protein YncE